MIENIDLEKKKKNLSYKKCFCESARYSFLERVKSRLLVLLVNLTMMIKVRTLTELIIVETTIL